MWNGKQRGAVRLEEPAAIDGLAAKGPSKRTLRSSFVRAMVLGATAVVAAAEAGSARCRRWRRGRCKRGAPRVAERLAPIRSAPCAAAGTETLLRAAAMLGSGWRRRAEDARTTETLSRLAGSLLFRRIMPRAKRGGNVGRSTSSQASSGQCACWGSSQRPCRVFYVPNSASKLLITFKSS